MGILFRYENMKMKMWKYENLKIGNFSHSFVCLGELDLGKLGLT